MTNDVSLFLGLATATATALGAAVGLGLLRPDRTGRGSRERAAAVSVLSVAVLGIGAALIAVGKGHTTGLLTWLMFLGLAAPALFALRRALARLVLAKRAMRAVFYGLCIASVALIGITSPDFIRELFNPHDIYRERADAMAATNIEHRTNYSTCRSNGRDCPGPAYVTFNTYKNNPTAGNERYFTGAAHALGGRLLGGRPDVRQDLIANVVNVRPGDEVIVRIYFNNAADASRFPAGSAVDTSVTENARVAVSVPTGESAGLVVWGWLYADNARPRAIRDAVAIVSEEVVSLEYVEGSATLANGYFRRGLKLPDDIVVSRYDERDPASNGTPLGYEQLDGRIEGSFAQAGWITVRLRVY
jgi:hypothetical protein